MLNLKRSHKYVFLPEMRSLLGDYHLLHGLFPLLFIMVLAVLPNDKPSREILANTKRFFHSSFHPFCKSRV